VHFEWNFFARCLYVRYEGLKHSSSFFANKKFANANLIFATSKQGLALYLKIWYTKKEFFRSTLWLQVIKKLWKLLIERDMKKKDLNNKTSIIFADDRVKAIRIYKLK
jgi:hypothetical protein